MSKLIFETFRYHLVPISVKNQLKIFGNNYSPEEIKSRKNEFLSEILTQNFTNISGRNSSLPLRLEKSEDDIFIFKIANKKTTEITKDFKTEKIDHEPFIYIVFNNDPSIQKIIIERNLNVFSSTDYVKNMLDKTLNSKLELYGLTIHIEKTFDKAEFWELIKKNQGKIQGLKFELIKPNLADISKTFKNDLRRLVDSTNSHKTNFNLNAPPKGTLENLNKGNKQLNSLVEYNSEGGGADIKIKIKGIKKTKSTSNMVCETSIDEVILSGNVNTLPTLLKGFFE